jgi:hypothetical protein
MRTSPSLALATCFRQAYDRTLSNHHGYVVRKVVGVAILAVPARSDFYARISKSAPDDTVAHAKLDERLDPWLAALESLCTRMKHWMEERGLGKVTM